MSSQTDYIGQRYSIIGETFEIESVFSQGVCNKIYRLYSNQIYRCTRNNFNFKIYGQRLDINSSMQAILFGFKEDKNDKHLILDSNNNVFDIMDFYQDNLHLIKNDGTLVEYEPVNMFKISYGEIVLHTNLTEQMEKVYAIWGVIVK